MLVSHGLPRAASQQFQHSYLSTTSGEHSDYRYDLDRIGDCDYLDFFYSGSVDVVHEADDVELVMQHNQLSKPPLKAIYASCDYHVGPEVVSGRTTVEPTAPPRHPQEASRNRT